jgi:hypothetical protein
MPVNPAEIELSPQQREYVALRAEQTGRPWSQLLAELVPAADAVGNGSRETAYDVAQRLGILAMSDEGPVDLATNPIHMTGFGTHDHGIGAR